MVVSIALPHSPISPLNLFSSDSSSSQLTNSNAYRLQLFVNALSPGRLALFGTKAASLTAGILPGYNSVDSAYLFIADQWGIVSMVALLSVAGAVAVSLWRLRREGVWSSVAAITLANFVGLLFVALITQQSFYIWALVGATAAIAEPRGSGEPDCSRGAARQHQTGCAQGECCARSVGFDRGVASGRSSS